MLQLYKQMLATFDQGQRQALVTVINADPGLRHMIGQKWLFYMLVSLDEAQGAFHQLVGMILGTNQVARGLRLFMQGHG